MVTESEAAEMRVRQLVGEYLRKHPGLQYPTEEYRHPSTLAMSAEIKHWMVDKLGGPVPYWRLLFSAAKNWFPERCGTESGKLFCQRLEIEAAALRNRYPELKSLFYDYLEWRGLDQPADNEIQE